MSKKIWDYDTCYKEASKYTTKSEFAKNNRRAYRVAAKNGWFNDYTWFIETRKPSGYWNRKTSYAAAKKCKTRAELSKKYVSAYMIARKNGWLDDYTWLMTEHDARSAGHRGPLKWTYDTCYDAAEKCSYKEEFRQKNI